MIKNFFLLVLKLFDFFNQRKIFNFLKKNNYTHFDYLFDIGAHRGETIKLYINNFDIKFLYSFEASHINYLDLINNLKKYNKNEPKIITENYAIGSENKKIRMKQMEESSSSTLREINTKSKYFKKKSNILFSRKKEDFFHDIETEQITLKEYLHQNKIPKIDFLKIDTEGYEYEVLLGLGDSITKVKIVLFEHHYHDMIKKNYKFSDIHKLLVKNNFSQIYKSKMPFRKTFEYIYIFKN